jgi:hypothetical protein
MHAARGIAQPATSRIAAVFILKYAIDNQDLLSSWMAMGLKNSARCPAHQRYVLSAKSVQRHNLQPPNQAWKPGLFLGIDY